MIPDKCLAKLCQEAYEKHSWSKDGTELLVRLGEGNITIAFRGTTFNGLDILKDMRATPWWNSELGGWFHHGFLRGALNAREYVEPLVQTTKLPVILTGHSKGGAEAQILAMLLAKKVGDLKVVTFGSPRVGFNQAQKLLANVSCTLYRNGIDAVTQVPTILPWKHAVPLKTLYAQSKDRFGNHRIREYVQAL